MRRQTRSPTNKRQLQDAKNRLSEFVRKAREEGPQVITLCGDDAVVVLAADDDQKLQRKPKGNLVDFFHPNYQPTVVDVLGGAWNGTCRADDDGPGPAHHPDGAACLLRQGQGGADACHRPDSSLTT